MAYRAQAVDTTEKFSDVDWEIVANLALYNVVTGCALTADGSNMTVDLAAGTITHNGAQIIVAAQANAVTLVADGTHPRWAWIWVNSSGAAGITHGTAAADPSKPELGDNTVIAAVNIGTGITLATNATLIDKRIPAVTASTYQPAQILNAGWYVSQGGAVLNTSATWTTANAAIYTPVQVTQTVKIKKLYHKNGATAGTDNVDVGIYDSDSDGLPSARLVSIGPTATSGTNAWQAFDVTDTTLSPGEYYLAAAMNGTTDTSLRLGAITIAESRDFSIYQELSAGTLPSSATPVVFSATRNVPLLLMSRGTG